MHMSLKIALIVAVIRQEFTFSACELKALVLLKHL